jgi:hypothetical protein
VCVCFLARSRASVSSSFYFFCRMCIRSLPRHAPYHASTPCHPTKQCRAWLAGCDGGTTLVASAKELANTPTTPHREDEEGNLSSSMPSGSLSLFFCSHHTPHHTPHYPQAIPLRSPGTSSPAGQVAAVCLSVFLTKPTHTK